MKHKIRKNQLDFILAGKACFILKNSLTGNHFSYEVKRNKSNTLWNVYSASEYLGSIRPNQTFKASESVEYSNRSRIAFNWLLVMLVSGTALPPQVHLYHLGICGRCGRTLTDPASVDDGMGPHCRKLVGY